MMLSIAGRDRLLDAVLNDRLVDERQHFLGLRFGRREEAGAETGGREDGFADDGRHGRIVAEDLGYDANRVHSV